MRHAGMTYVGALAEALDVQVLVADAVRSDQLDLASRCSTWSIRDVLEHSVGVTRKFTEFAAGGTDEPHADGAGVLGVDHVEAVRAAAAGSSVAWSKADMSRECQLRFGTFPAEVAAGINLFDVLAHTWDIAAAVGLELPADDDLWDAGLRAAQRVIPAERDLTQYAPAIACDPDAGTMVRFLAFLGRDAMPA